MKNIWKEEETNKFIDLYPTVPTDELVLIFNRSKTSLVAKAYKLGIKKTIRADGLRYIEEEEKIKIIEGSKYHSIPELEVLFNRDFSDIKKILLENNCNILPSSYWWTKEEEDFLKENFESGNPDYISNFLNRKWKSISKKAREMGMKRISSNGNYHLSPKPLSEYEIKFIVDNCSKMSISMLSKKLNRSRSVITDYCKKNNLCVLKLRKSPENYSDEFLLEELNRLALLMGRCPSGEEIQRDFDFPSVDIYYDRFGSFSNACELAGLLPNIGRYGTLCYSKNGDKCYSIGEQIITNFLIDKDVEYEKEYLYQNIIPTIKTGIVMDWCINKSVVVEYFGMQKFERYELKTEFKQKTCIENNIKIISIFPKDLKYLNNIFKEFIK